MKLIIIIFLTTLYLFYPLIAFAQPNNINCDNRYLTLVNPVRNRKLWFDNSLNPLKDQYHALVQHGFPATWLLQYDILKDQEALNLIKSFGNSQEIGLFLEISPTLSSDARVIYPEDAPWFYPNAVFLSGYTQSDRKKLIDKDFAIFKKEFKTYPKSVGAWWIDSYSLNYMREKYDIDSTMIVADQRTTDKYGVWGQWWGVAYYPTKANILTPASNLDNKQNIVVIQWAQRDPRFAYGEGPRFSNYSLQANDYIDRGQNIRYFKHLAQVYLDCQNPVGQITVGLETGIESVEQIDEYQNQLSALEEMTPLKALTMSQFASQFAKVYPAFPKQETITWDDSKWILNTSQRSNQKFGDDITYNQSAAFQDYFLADKNNFLNRQLPNIVSQNDSRWYPWFLLVIVGLGFFAYSSQNLTIWVVASLFTIASYGLILKSHDQFGWQVFYGPRVINLAATQIILVIISYALIWLLSRWQKIKHWHFFLWLIPLSFSVDPLTKLARYSFISGKHLVGIASDSLHFTGLAFNKSFNVEFINKDLPFYQAAALLRLDFNKIWDNLWLSLIVYPLVHLVIAATLGWLLLKLPKKVTMIIVTVMICFLIVHLIQIANANPRLVLPIK